MKRYKPILIFTRQQESIIYKLLNLKFNKKLNESTFDYAKDQLQQAGLFDSDSDYNGTIGDAVLQLIQIFSNQGHSGYSASIVRNLFNKLSNFEPICPIENPIITNKYEDVSKMSSQPLGSWLQSTELSSMFSNDYGKTWYCLITIYHMDENGVEYSTVDKKYIDKFPFIYDKKDFEINENELHN